MRQGVGRAALKLIVGLGTNLRGGGGMERFVYQLVRTAPPDVRVTILQTADSDAERMPPEVIDFIREKAELVTLTGFYERFSFLNRLRFVWPIFLMIVPPLVARRLRRQIRGILDNIDRDTVIYLLSNELCTLFEGKDVAIVGSNHIQMIRTQQLRYRLVYFLVASRLLWRRIDYFHLLIPQPSLPQAMRGRIALTLGAGVDAGRFKPQSRQGSSRVVFTYFGRLVPEKGVLRLIQAWEPFRNRPDLELRIVGTGPLDRVVADRCSDNMRFVGPASDSRVEFELGTSDVFVYPTDTDVKPFVILEALSSGLHVIAGRCLIGGLDDAEALGFLEYVEVEPNAISASIEHCVESIAHLRSQREAIHDYMLRNYDWARVSERFYAAMNAVQVSHNAKSLRAKGTDGL